MHVRTAFAMAGLLVVCQSVAAAQQPRLYIELHEGGTSTAARLLPAKDTPSVRVSYTSRSGASAIYTFGPRDNVSGTEFASNKSAPNGMTFFSVPGERNPLLLVTLAIEERETYYDELFLAFRDGKLGPVEQLALQNKADAGDKLVDANLTVGRKLYEYVQYGTAGGAGAWYNDGRRRYFLRLHDGRPAILLTSYFVNDYEHETKATPPPDSAASCVNVYRTTSALYAVPCP